MAWASLHGRIVLTAINTRGAAWLFAPVIGAALVPRGFGVEPEPPVRDVRSATTFACALDLGGDLSCWGVGDSQPGLDEGRLAGPFSQLECGFRRCCVVAEGDGSVTCLQASDHFLGERVWLAHPGPVADVAVGTESVCVRTPQDRLECQQDDSVRAVEGFEDLNGLLIRDVFLDSERTRMVVGDDGRVVSADYPLPELAALIEADLFGVPVEWYSVGPSKLCGRSIDERVTCAASRDVDDLERFDDVAWFAPSLGETSCRVTASTGALRCIGEHGLPASTGFDEHGDNGEGHDLITLFYPRAGEGLGG